MVSGRTQDSKKPAAQNRNPAKHRGAGESPTARITGWRLWVFRLIAVVGIPLVLLLLAELVLRAVGYGYPAGTVVKCTVKGRPAYCSNAKFGWRFFPPEIAREFDHFVVPAEKSDNTYRIFILGESAALGTPEPSYGFGRFLRIMLRQQYPGVNFEVFTVAMPAINSHALVLIAKDCAKLKPDLFVLYMGNNEVVGPYGAGTVFTPLSKNLRLIRIGIAIKGTKIGQAITRLVALMARNKETPQTWGGLEMFLSKQIRQSDPQMAAVYGHFQRNLEDIIRIALGAKANVICSTVGANLKDNPPFASLHRLDLSDTEKTKWKRKWEDIFQQGVAFEKAGSYTEAIEKYLATADIDDTYAELQFRLGRCYWNLNEFDKAGDRYARALELDTLRFRADGRINEIIRTAAANRAREGVYLVDAAKVFEKNSPHHSTGLELFLEHAHLNFTGNYLLAGTILEQVEQILPEHIRKAKNAQAAQLSEADCAERLAFTRYDQYVITEDNYSVIRKAPYINQIYHDELTELWRQKTETLAPENSPVGMHKATEQYRKAIELDSSDRWLRLNYAKLLEWQKNLRGAMEQYRLLIEQMPHDHHALVGLANLEGKQGDVDPALMHATKAVEIMPTSYMANYITGLAYQMKGKLKQAQKHFARTIQLGPNFGAAYTNLGKVLSQQNKNEDAEKVYRKGISVEPNNPYLHLNLGLLLKKKGQMTEARKEIQTAVKLDPNLPGPPRPTIQVGR